MVIQAIFLVLQTQAKPLDLSLVPELKVEGAFTYELKPVPELLSELGSRAGVLLKCDRSIEDFKLDVFVKSMPTSKLLMQIATLLGGEWEKDGAGYTLSMTEPEKSAQKNLKVVHLQERRKYAELFVAAYEYVALQKDPETLVTSLEYPEAKEHVEKGMRGLRARLEQAMARGNAEAIRDIKSQMIFAESSLLNQRFMEARFLQKAASLGKLWSGEILLGSTQPGSDIQLHSTDGRVPNINGKDILNSPTKTSVILLKWDATQARFIGKLIQTDLQGSSQVGGLDFPNIYFLVDSELTKMPGIANWITDPKTIAQSTIAKVSVDQSTRFWKTDWLKNRCRLGDHLQWLHRSTGISILAIADRNSHPSSFTPKPPPPNGRIGDYHDSQRLRLQKMGVTVSQFIKELNFQKPIFTRVSEESLLVRPQEFWDPKREIPETLWREYEAPAKDLPVAQFSRMKALAKKIKLEDLGSFHTSERVSKVSLYPLIDLLYVLRFYETLNANQRQYIEKDSGLFFNRLSIKQKQDFKTLVLDALVRVGSPTDKLTNLLMRGKFLDFEGTSIRMSRFVHVDNIVKEEGGGISVFTPDIPRTPDGKLARPRPGERERLRFEVLIDGDVFLTISPSEPNYP